MKDECGSGWGGVYLVRRAEFNEMGVVWGGRVGGRGVRGGAGLQGFYSIHHCIVSNSARFFILPFFFFLLRLF